MILWPSKLNAPPGFSEPGFFTGSLWKKQPKLFRGLVILVGRSLIHWVEAFAENAINQHVRFASALAHWFELKSKNQYLQSAKNVQNQKR